MNPGYRMPAWPRRRWLGAALALPLAGGPAWAARPAEAAGPRFDWRSARLMNLHHFLYDSARRDAALARPAWVVPPSEAERQALLAAVAHYARHHAGHDALFDEGLNALKTALSAAPDAATGCAGLDLPPALAAVLEAALPAYLHCLWPAHDAQNRRWIRIVSALDAHHGAAVWQRLQSLFDPGLRRGPLRVDLVWQTGLFVGAYTTEQPPLTVLPSGRSDYQGLAGLEMLFHEASHVGMLGGLMRQISAGLEARGRPPEPQLWHALQFYTVGRVVTEALAAAGLPYRSYAEQRGLYRVVPGWATYLQLLEQHWGLWIEGRLPRDQALARLIDGLPAGGASRP